MEVVGTYRTINHISFVGIDDIHFCQCHREIPDDVRLIVGIMSCCRISLDSFRYFCIKWQTDGAPTIILIITCFFDNQFVGINKGEFNLVCRCTKTTTLVGCTHTIITRTVGGEVDIVICHIRLINPLSCFIQFKEEVTECFFLVIPLQFVVIQYQFVCPDDVILCIYLFLIFILFASF